METIIGTTRIAETKEIMMALKALFEVFEAKMSVWLFKQELSKSVQTAVTYHQGSPRIVAGRETQTPFSSTG